MKKFKLLTLGILALLVFTKCGNDDNNTTPVDTTTTLFDDLGGTSGITAVVDELVGQISVDNGDNGIADHFEVVLSGSDTEQAAFKESIVKFLSDLTGSTDIRYDGPDMKSAHDVSNPGMSGMIIADADFTRFIELVGAAATEVGVSTENINTIASALEQYRGDIVTSLFDDLGGTTGITTVVQKTVALIATDIGPDGIADNFEVILSSSEQEQTAFIESIVAFISIATGSTSATYDGPTMEEAHDVSYAGMNGTTISNADFTRFVGFVAQGAIDTGVSLQNVARVGAIMETLRTDIVSTLYEDLGGQSGIEAVVDDAIMRITTDDLLIPYFEQILVIDAEAEDETGATNLRNNLVDYISVVTGATDVEYEGLSMADAHDPAINERMVGQSTEEAFNKFITHIGDAAKHLGVSDDDVARVAAVLNRDMEAIVGP